MATRAEQQRSDEQRKGRGGRTSVKKTRKGRWSHDKGHAASKATHALEESKGRPSRESTRASANRSKADAAMNVTEETRKGSPESLARKNIARRSRVRGSSA